MAKRLFSLLLTLLLCFTYTGACALVMQVGDETYILDDSVSSESSAISIITEDGTILENGDVVPVQTPNAQWLHDQLENTDQMQLLQDITYALYLANCLQTRDTSSAENITVDSLEDYLDFFFDDSTTLTLEGTDSCYLALSDASYMRFNLDGIYITGASLYLSAVENAFGQSVCVDFLLQ